MTHNDFSISFICQKGDLEIKSLILVSSLKQYLNCNYELIAFIPKSAPASQSTIEQLSKNNVKIKFFDTPIKGYYISNKIAALDYITTKKYKIFLDSDIILINQTDFNDIKITDVAIKPIDIFKVYPPISEWEKYYNLFDITPSDKEFKSTVDSVNLPYPYFNAGVIIIKSDINISKTWLEIAKSLYYSNDFNFDHFFTDQIAFVLATATMNLNVDSLNQTYNYPAHLLNNITKEAKIIHYHKPSHLFTHPNLLKAFKKTLHNNTYIKGLIANSPDWSAYQTKNSFKDIFNAIFNNSGRV